MIKDKSKFVIGIIIALLIGVIVGLILSFTVQGESKRVINLEKDAIITTQTELNQIVDDQINKLLYCLDKIENDKNKNFTEVGELGAAVLNCVYNDTKYKSLDASSQNAEYVLSQLIHENNIFTNKINDPGTQEQKFIVLKWLVIRLILSPLVIGDLNGGLPCEPWDECWNRPCEPWSDCLWND